MPADDLRAAVPHGAVGRDRPRHPAGLGGRHHPVAARLSRARQPRAGRGAGADGHARQRAEGRTAKLILQTKTDGAAGFPGRRLRDAGQGARLRQLRQGRCRAGRDQGPRRPGRAAGQRPCRHDHRSGRRQGPLPGHRAARQRAAGRRPRTPISASPSSSRPSSGWRWRGTTARPRAAARALGTGAPAA